MTATRQAKITLSVYSEPVEISVDVPTGRTTPRRMLPIFREACHAVVDGAIRHAEKNGRTVSCRAGCGACCRQLVPVSPTEARELKRVFQALPPQRKAVVAKRFEDAADMLKEAGILKTLRSPAKPTGEQYKDLALRYFALGAPCPFLEDESCSIHPDRPLVCREYLVVSPPENCARKNNEPIEVLAIPGEASKALTAVDGGPGFRNWVPLVLAMEWAEDEPSSDPARPGIEIAQQFFKHLTGAEV